MLEGYDVTRLRFELAAHLAAPRAVFKALVHPGCLLNRRNVLPGLVVARAISTMQRIEDAKLRVPRSIQDLQHIRNALICFCNSLQETHNLPSLKNEIVVRINNEKCSHSLSILDSPCFFSYSGRAATALRPLLPTR